MTARLLLEYDGRRFAGWARQPGRRTVQGEVEAALAVLRRAPVATTVAGRTDAGVHAAGQVVSHPGGPAPLRGLNALLPPDVAVLRSERAPDGFDARRDAVSRSYRYDVLARPARSALLAGRVLHEARPLDPDALAACAAALVGHHDLTAFTPTDTEHVLFERTVLAASWAWTGPDVLSFHVTAPAFMRNMVRILVGTMLEVGRGARPAEDFARLLDGAPRSAAGVTAPPDGLVLERVTFPDGWPAGAAPGRQEGPPGHD